MNNLKSTVNFESSPFASSQAPNLNATTSMMGGRRRRRKRSKKGGMVVEPETPEKDRGSRVAPIIEKVPLEDLIDDEKTIENAEDKEYEDLEKQLGNEDKIREESYKIDINEDEDVLDKLERGENIENSLDEKSGGTRRRTRKTKHKKTQKLSRKTKKIRKYNKSKKTKKSNKKNRYTK
jgi:hypothetical protein